MVGGGSADAHRTSLADATITVADRTVDIGLVLSAHDLAVALGIDTDLVAPVPRALFDERRDALRRYLAGHLAVANRGRRCNAATVRLDFDRSPDDLAAEVVYICEETIDRLAVGYRLFFAIDPDHRAFGRIELPDGGREELLFDRTLTTVEFDLDRTTPHVAWGERFLGLVELGIEHILFGYDHVLFLLALLVANSRSWAIVKVVTAFTVAHSLTLALAWYGVVDLPSRLVEILIAVSIGYVALENILGRGGGHRWVLAGGFGLVHGLGFYGALSAFELAGGDAVTTLLAFNVGVEVGQLIIVAVCLLPLVWWQRQPWHRRSAQAFSWLILAVSSWWVIERAGLV